MRMRITHAVATPTFDRREMLLRRVSLSLAVASGWRRLSSDVRAVSGSMKLHRSLLMLGLGQHAEPGQVKEAYLELAKVYHPDSGSAQASHHKFIQVSSPCPKSPHTHFPTPLAHPTHIAYTQTVGVQLCVTFSISC